MREEASLGRAFKRYMRARPDPIAIVNDFAREAFIGLNTRFQRFTHNESPISSARGSERLVLKALMKSPYLRR